MGTGARPPSAGSLPLTAYFDIGDTLGTARFVPGTLHLAGLDVFPFVPEVLAQLQADGIRLGVISNKGTNSEATVRHVLDQAGILHRLDPHLLIFGVKDSPVIFRQAAERAGHAAMPDACLFVGEAETERAFARQAGFRVAADPRAARETLLAGR
jgi:beta-phosphoglucomutase-like phosphatase (HAD superfamily)